MTGTWSFFVPAFAAMTAGRAALDVRSGRAWSAPPPSSCLPSLLLDLLGVRIDAFRMAEGLLLLLTALDTLRAKQAACRCSKEEFDEAKAKDDIAVVPLAIPLPGGDGRGAALVLGAMSLQFIVEGGVNLLASIKG